MGFDQLFPSIVSRKNFKSSENQFSERLLKLYEITLLCVCLMKDREKSVNVKKNRLK